MLKNVFFVSLLAAAVAQSAVVRLEIKERSDILDGKAFGIAYPSGESLSW